MGDAVPNERQTWQDKSCKLLSLPLSIALRAIGLCSVRRFSTFNPLYSMAKSFRIASFNVENLFSRAKVLNLQDHIRAEQILKQIGELKSLLAKTSYTAAVKAQVKT